MDELLEARSVTAGDYADRDGFDEHFLGVSVPLPALSGVQTTELAYTTFRS